jgi:GNAT superfamily N-acetyltransferase
VPAGTWSLNCFFVPRAWRGKGVARALLDGAVAHALASGATEIEGYPVVPKAGTRPPAAFVYTGVASLFEAAGFAPVAEGSKTWVLRAHSA